MAIISPKTCCLFETAVFPMLVQVFLCLRPMCALVCLIVSLYVPCLCCYALRFVASGLDYEKRNLVGVEHAISNKLMGRETSSTLLLYSYCLLCMAV
jgi:hypothetical protein